MKYNGYPRLSLGPINHQMSTPNTGSSRMIRIHNNFFPVLAGDCTILSMAQISATSISRPKNPSTFTSMATIPVILVKKRLL